jgi:arylsulfatase A-like enzyme
MEFDGQDFSQVMLSGKVPAERPLYWRFRNQQAVRSGPWKLMADNEEMYLYNLDADPGEMRNLREVYPDIADSLRLLLRNWAAEMEPYELLTE